MLTVALRLTEETNESIGFLSWFKDGGLKSIVVEDCEPVDVLVVVDRTGEFQDRLRIYDTHGHLIGPQTEVFYIYPGGKRFEQIQIHEEHKLFFHVGAFEDNFWKSAYDEAHRFISASRENKLKML